MADAGDWEVAVSKKNKVPTPVARMSALRNHLIPKDIHLSTPKEIVLKPMKERKSDMTVLAQLLGFIPIDDIPGSARELFRHAILICLDLEHWSYNSNKTTEVGLVIYDMHDITPIVHSKQLGDHGEELLKCGKHHFFRIAQHAHLEKGNDEILGPEGNVFGKCRFTELEELRDILKKCFVQPLVGVPQHEGCHRPIVVLGHDGKHDWENLMDKAVSTNLVEYGTVVRFIDTQELHRSTGDWDEVYNRVGLRTLIHFFDFEHEQGHTAANDASRTAICAFQAVLRLGAKNCDDCWNAKNDCIKTMQQVANDLETHSVAMYNEIGGSPLYCIKCASHYHMAEQCKEADLHCDYCQAKGCEQTGTHVTRHCQAMFDAEGAARRAKFAWEKEEERKEERRTGEKKPKAPRAIKPWSGWCGGY
jgi:hypothetical protein